MDVNVTDCTCRDCGTVFAGKPRRRKCDDCVAATKRARSKRSYARLSTDHWDPQAVTSRIAERNDHRSVILEREAIGPISELDELIAEQARDMKYGHRVYRPPWMWSLDQCLYYDGTTFMDVVRAVDGDESDLCSTRCLHTSAQL